MRILSLFDGMSCGMIAFKQLGIEVDSYTAYEIDKFAVKVATHNFPEIIEKGDVFQGDFTQYEGVDYVIGGSPCTYWSIAQSPDKRETTASGIGWELFQQYVRAINQAKPKYFIYENNKSMAKNIYDSISDAFGFEPIMINSALVSAQNRERYYWVGKRNDEGKYDKVRIEQPKDRGILLKDILITGEDLTGNDKSYCVTANIDGAHAQNTIERSQRTMVAEPVNTQNGKAHTVLAGYYKTCTGMTAQHTQNRTASRVAIRVMDRELESVSNDGNYGIMKAMCKDADKRVYTVGKGPAVTTCEGGNREPKVFMQVGGQTAHKLHKVENGQIEIKGKKYPVKLKDGYYVIRKLTVRECARLQTIPEWYEFNISNSQSYKCIGNGWTIEVIMHLIRATIEGKIEPKQLTFWEV